MRVSIVNFHQGMRDQALDDDHVVCTGPHTRTDSKMLSLCLSVWLVPFPALSRATRYLRACNPQ